MAGEVRACPRCGAAGGASCPSCTEGGIDEVRHLLDVGRTIVGSLELKEVLAFACTSLAEMIQASTAFAILLDEPTRTLRIVACSNPKLLERTRDLRMGLDATSMAAECVRTRRA